MQLPRTPEERQAVQAQCTIEQATDRDEPAVLRAHASPQLAAALASWETLWSFLNNPGTSYLDRLAAAAKGSALVTPEHLAEFWTAASQPGTQSVNPSPCCLLSCSQVLYAPPGLPAYPISPEDRNRSPIAWQRSRAVEILGRELGTYYADANRYPAMVRALEGWRTTGYSEEQARKNALLRGPRNLEWLRVAIRLGEARSLYVCCNDRYPFEELVHAAQLVALVNAKDYKAASDALYEMASLAQLKYAGPARDLKPLRTATATLAAASWAMRQDIDTHSRYYLVGSLMKLIEMPPMTFDPQLPPNDPKQREGIMAFEKWFTEHREQLEREAAAERPHLQELLAQLNAAGDRWVLP